MCSNHGTCNNGLAIVTRLKKMEKLSVVITVIKLAMPYCGVHANDTKGCSGHGECVDKICKCEKGFYGEYCSKKCPADCNGNGKCSDNGVCKCNVGFSGKAVTSNTVHQ